VKKNRNISDGSASLVKDKRTATFVIPLLENGEVLQYNKAGSKDFQRLNP
jgi:hypothetical protein